MRNVDWSGIFTVLVTPFDQKLGIDRGRFDWLVDQVLAEGANGLIVAGSTGEFYTLTLEERQRLFAAAVGRTRGRVPVIAGVSDLRLDDVIRVCAAAADAGCAGGMLLPPIYAMPGDEEIVGFYTAVARAVPLPLMLYNSPRRVGVNLSPELVVRLAELPTVVAIKDSSASIVQVGDLLHRVAGQLRVFVGYETMLLPALAMGVDGVVAMAHQVAGTLVRRFYELIVAGDLAAARELERDVFAIYECFQVGSYYAAIKETMRQVGRAVGDPRPPLQALDAAQRGRVRAILARSKLCPELITE